MDGEQLDELELDERGSDERLSHDAQSQIAVAQDEDAELNRDDEAADDAESGSGLRVDESG